MKASLVHARPTLLNNKYFAIEDSMANMNDVLYPMYLLKKKMSQNDIFLSTYDLKPVADSEIVIFDEMPLIIPEKKPGQKYYLLAIESMAVWPINFDKNRYKAFDKIFTWYDNYINEKNIIKINYSFKFNKVYSFNIKTKNKFLCMINNNKNCRFPNELYSERIKIVKWFTKYHPKEFDLYGHDWDIPFRTTFWGKVYNKFKLKRILLAIKLKVYKGAALPKQPILEKYKFAICYENVYGISGYITEKIFDCFFAGTVPIYLGAPNITDWIPENTFIDKRNFSNLNDLYQYLINISEVQYQEYLNNIKKFLESDKVKPFSAEYYADTIVNHILADINNK